VNSDEKDNIMARAARRSTRPNRKLVASCNESDRDSDLLHSPSGRIVPAGEFLILNGPKRRKRITEVKAPMLQAVIRIIEELRDYWPISDRTVHYELLNDPPVRNIKRRNLYENADPSYQDLTELLTRARLESTIPFEAIADPTRKIETWYLHRHVDDFLADERDRFLEGYCRDLQQGQPNHIEIIVEKLTAEGSITDVAARYGIPYTVGRGQCSLDPRHKLVERFRASGKGNLILLILSDFDVAGQTIAHSFAESIRDDFGVDEVYARKVALTHAQVRERDLPHGVPVKKPRNKEGEIHENYQRFIKAYGNYGYELEALSPEERARLIDEAIREVMDLDVFEEQVAAQRADLRRIERLKMKVDRLVEDVVNDDEEDHPDGHRRGG
jgi:hypothetical protein